MEDSKGMSILLVDNDDNSLNYLSSMLQQYSYQVTSTELAMSALSMVDEQKDRFEMVMANDNIPDMDILQFLHLLLDKDIPVILVSGKSSEIDAKKALDEGASLYLSEPIFPVDLKHIWQHAYKNKRSTENKSESEPEGNMKRQIEEKQGQNGKEKRVKINDQQLTLEEEKKEGKRGRPRVVWTSDLHFKFTAAISKLGDKKTRPKAILKNMKVPNLTARQVASHLQKYRSQVEKIYENGNILDLAPPPPPLIRSSNFRNFNNTSASSSSNHYQPTNFGINGTLIDIIRASPNNCTPAVTTTFETNNEVSLISNLKRQEMDCIALIKSLDDGYEKVGASNPSNGRDLKGKNHVLDTSNYVDEDGFVEWLDEMLNMDTAEMPNLDMIMESDAKKYVVNIVEKDKIVSEPNPNDRYLSWIAQTLLEDD